MSLLLLRRLAACGAIAGLTLTGVVVNTTSASANSGSGHYPCLSNDLCYWYHPNFQGAAEGVRGKVNDLANPATRFEGAAGADGVGQPVWNDAASAANFDSDCRYGIYFHANQTGTSVILAKFGQNGYQVANLGALRNENRSQNVCV